MKSRITKTVALAALLASGAVGAANATEGWYGRVDVGRSTDGHMDFGDGDEVGLETEFSQPLGLGYGSCGSPFRLEGEVSHRYNDFGSGILEDGDVHAWAGMINGYWDLWRGERADVYIGAGVGGARFNSTAMVGGGEGYVGEEDT